VPELCSLISPAAASDFTAAGNPIGGGWGTEWIRDWTR